VELQLKRLIPTGALLVNQEISEADRKRLLEHPLDKLWALFEPILQKAARGTVAMTPEEIEGLGWYVAELNKFDPGSFSGRYALDRVTCDDAAPGIDQDRRVKPELRNATRNLRDLRVRMVSGISRVRG
jgi:hypothetical protein